MKKIFLFFSLVCVAFLFSNVNANGYSSTDLQLLADDGNYTISYELSGGTWSNVTKEEMKIDFLTDFYNYINPTENLTTFMHGAGNTSGYDGTWHSVYKDSLYQTNDKESNAEKPYFINQPEYNSKWVPFFDLLEVLVRETNSTQSFWGSTYVGLIRIREYFIGTRYADDNRIPSNLVNPLDYKKNYREGTLPLILPIPTKTGYEFAGWYDNPEFNGPAVTAILNGDSGNKTFYARWVIEYSLTYQLNGGAWTIQSRNALKDAFLLDFYNFIQPTENLTTFKHGVGNTSGYDGTWHSTYKAYLYDLNKKEIDLASEYFINQPEYNARWLPFFNLIDQFITEINAEQNLWGSTWTGLIRLRQYFIDDALFASKTTLPSVVGPAKYLSDSNKITLPNPTKSGVNFLGWYDNANFTGSRLYEIAAGSTGNKTLYAKWGFSISYVLNGGTNNIENPTSYTIEGLPITLKNPTRNNYTFQGWYDNASFTGTAITSINAGTTGNKTYYAKWVPTVFSISYVLNGGSNNSSNPATFTVETLPVTLNNPTRSGYTFLGWYDNSNFTGSAITSITTVGNKTLYAKWEAINYTITYVLNGGTNDLANPATYNGNILPLTLNSPVRNDYIFKGWYDNSTFSGTPITSLIAGTTGNKTLYAKWEAIIYTITYNLNGGSNNSSNPSSFTVVNLPITLSNPTKIGYTFLGWYDNSSFTGSVVTNITTTGSKTLYAKWVATSYSINYILDGGTNNVNNPTSYTLETLPINLVAPTKEGYYFMGWYDNSSFVGNAITSITTGSTGNWTLYAKWADSTTYNITYVLNGGTNNAANPATYSAGNLPLTLLAPTKTGYDFLGWYDNANFTGAPITEITSGATGNKSFYAKWKVKEYTITYQLNSGSWAFTSRNALKDAFLQDFYNFVQPTEDLTTFKHGVGKTTGYDGTWHSTYKAYLYNKEYKVVDSNSIYFINQLEYNTRWLPFYNLLDSFVTEINPAQSFWGDTYTGFIRIRQYFIDDPLFSGKTTLPTCAGPAKYTIESNKVTLPTPTKSSSVFLGWYTTSDFSGSRIYDIATNSTGNKTYYAKWSVPNIGSGYIDLTYASNQALTIGSTVKVSAGWKKVTLSDSFTWSSSNPAIATVDASGNVKGIKAGTVMIRATSVSTGLIAEVGFTVYGSEITDPLLRYLITQNTGKLFTQNVYYIGYNGSYWNRIYNTVNSYLAAPHDTVNTSLWLTGGIKGSGTPMTVSYLTIHDTGSAASTSTAKANGSWCINPSNTGSSWHYTIGNDGVYQHIADNRMAWHAGDGSGPGNTSSIGIETTVNNGSDIWWTWQKTAKVSGRLMVKYGLTMTQLKFHRDWSGKICPGTMINAGLTEEFRALVNTEYTIQKNYPGYTIKFQSHSPLIDNMGRVISRPTQNTNVTYTITVTKGTFSQSITLNGLVPGSNTW